MKVLSCLILSALLAAFGGCVSLVQADGESEDVINYAYSNWIGSGFYKVGDRTV